MRKFLLALALAIVPLFAHAQTLLVAKKQMEGPYAKTVLLAVPTPRGGHMGFILNVPTTQTLASMFPEFPPAKKVEGFVNVGGPEYANMLFALAPGDYLEEHGVKQLAPGLA